MLHRPRGAQAAGRDDLSAESRWLVAPQSTPIEGGYEPLSSGSRRIKNPTICRQIRAISLLTCWLRIPVAVLTKALLTRGFFVFFWSNRGPILRERGHTKGRSSSRYRTLPAPSGTGGRLTILVVDLVDLAGCEDESGDQPAALCCRFYRRGDGRISPTLDPADVSAALEVELRLARGGTRAWAPPGLEPGLVLREARARRAPQIRISGRSGCHDSHDDDPQLLDLDTGGAGPRGTGPHDPGSERSREDTRGSARGDTSPEQADERTAAGRSARCSRPMSCCSGYERPTSGS
jgi:hypothetical protein